jgi:Deacetylases, including yeast histone deacetylase and acetoin utilization protein
MNKQLVFMHSPLLDEGGYPDDCPFSSKRAGRTKKSIESLGLLNYSHTRIEEPISTSLEKMATFHTEEYLHLLEMAGNGELDYRGLAKGLGRDDCPLFQDLLPFIMLACGGTTTGAEMLLRGEADIVFNLSGGFHHAGPDSASGFCFINDVVLGSSILADAGKRVLILDVDAHHGDGVQNAFYTRMDVTTISLHESGYTLFPGTGFVDEIGSGMGIGYSINLPLPAGTYDEIYLWAFREIVHPLIEKIHPDVIVLELGMDALAGDPLTHLNLTNNSLADVFTDILDFNKPMLVVGGGGYHLNNTVRGWSSAWNIAVNGRESNVLMGAGMGGVMLQNNSWLGGLVDRALFFPDSYRESIDKEIKLLVERIKETIFPLHGL